MLAFKCDIACCRHKDLFAILAKKSLFAVFDSISNDMNTMAMRAKRNRGFFLICRIFDAEFGQDKILSCEADLRSCQTSFVLTHQKASYSKVSPYYL